MKEFKLIVAGSRDFNDYQLLSRSLMEAARDPDMAVSIVSGMARGADSLAVQFAKEHNVKLYKFPADWNQHGKRAGYLRNEQMAVFADGLLAFWDGQSKGTKHMINTMEQLGKLVHVVHYTKE